MVAASTAVMDVGAIVELDNLKQNMCVGVPRTFYFFNHIAVDLCSDF
jgi:hypothetical protein